MRDIELVIKIPEELYKWVNDVNKFFDDYGTSDFIDLVKNGTPLPEHHGRLIDADKATISCLEHTGKRSLLIDLAPTVIEADVTDMNVGKMEEENGREDQMV